MNVLNREVRPLNLGRFMNECCTKVESFPGSRYFKIVHSISGRLVRSIPSSAGNNDYFIIKLDDPNLFQRYMIAERFKIYGHDKFSVNIMRYESSLRAAESFLDGK